MTEPLSRRTVVRTAGHAAWITPAVIVAASVPAFAASGPAAISTTLVAPVRVTTSLPITATLSNANTQPTINLMVALRIEIPTAQTMVGVSSSTPNGYSLVSTVYASNTVVIFNFTATAQIAGNGAGTFAPTVTIGSVGSATMAGNAMVSPTVDAPGTATPSTKQSFN